MKYMGSKNRIAKHILPIMIAEADKQEITTWIEPFVGGGNMIDKVPERFTRISYDLNEHTIAAMLGIRDFDLVWQGEVKTNFSSGRKEATHNAVEKLFKV